MISPAKLEKFKPFGLEFCVQHPFAARSALEGDGTTSDKPLFVFNNTVVWSQGKCQEARTVTKCYTAKSPVLDFLWCSFSPVLEASDEKLLSLCIVQSECIDVLTKDGALYTISLPFPVAQIKSLPGGLLLERTTTPVEISGQKRDVPTIFSVLHPLDEPRPVTSKLQGKISYLCDPTVSVVFTCPDPPVIMTYDSVIGLHSVWKVTRAKPEDCPESPAHAEMPPELHFSSIMHHPTPVHISAGAHSRLSAATPTQSFSPFKPYTPTSAVKAHVQSPAPLRLMSPCLAHLSVSRIMSPVVDKALSQDSPLGIGLRSPMVFRTPPTSVCSSREESSWDSFQPLVPEVCLTHVWQELQIAVRYGIRGKASKAFLTQDKCGATYLCYLLGQLNKLRGVQITQREGHVHFDLTFEIPAKDVVPLEKLNMMLVLEPNFVLVLYSGPVKGCQVHMPSFPITQPKALLPFASKNQAVSLHNVDKGSSDVKMEDLTLQECQSQRKCEAQVTITALRDPVQSTCNLVLTDGAIYRITLPTLSQSSVVTACLESLSSVLPGPLAVQAHLAYYTLAHAPRSQDEGGELEWFSQCMQGLLGCPLNNNANKSDSPGIPAPKKSKIFREDNQSIAWQMLMKSAFHQEMKTQYSGIQTDRDSEAHGMQPHPSQTWLKRDALLFSHIPSILSAWTLIYEDLKLNLLEGNSLQPLAKLLCHLSKNLCWQSYVEHYCREFPSLFGTLATDIACVTKDPLTSEVVPVFKEAPNILQWLSDCLRGGEVEPFPVLPGITKKTFSIITLYSLFVPTEEGSYLNDPEKLFKCVTNSEEEERNFKASFVQQQEMLHRLGSPAHRVLAFLAENGITSQDLDCFPFGVVSPIREALHQCSADPPFNLPTGAYQLIGREDLASQLTKDDNNTPRCHGPLKKGSLNDGETDNGFNFDDEVLKLRFGKDLRVQEIQRLLQSSKPVTVSIVQRPEVSDHDFIQEQETRLLLMCKRTMALPVGRGMFTMATCRPVLTETLPIPPLDLTGRAPPRNTSVGLEHVEAPADMKTWPQFHNGVAAGLRIAPGISQIDSTWIVYNKPKNNQLTNEHAGFLMALGLNGHLKNLSYMNVHDYLCKGHELTTVGLLLGTAAAKRGTMDITATKMLSIHVDALLPPTSAELDVPHSAQVAAILGVGLVYQGTAQRRMAEVLISEIGRPPGPEMENAVNRESYSLAAGLALGLVMLQHGNEAASVADLKIADQLYHYMNGGQTKPQTGTQKEKFKSPSYQIKEGDSVNINVTGPGATLALGLMFMKTNNSSVAAWLSAPDTQFLLDFIRPDFLLLRLLSRSLILWDSIRPTTDWVESHIPSIVKQYDSCSESEAANAGVDLESLSQAKVNIIAGCCMAMGLRFAGSANQDAFSCLMHYTKHCKDLLGSPAVEQPGKPTVATCLSAILLSLAMVMAGTGNLDVLRIARQLRKRHSPDVHYGSHMAVHMAVGLLFLGGGRFTLNTSSASVAALLCAFYPRFPISSTDNRYHLQAFRHLYVLAAEPRVIVPRDVGTNKACYAPLEITLKETPFYPETCLKLTAPCIVPELHLIKKIRVVGSRYWSVTIDLTADRSNSSLLTSKLGTIYVKRRTGFLCYAEDPKGHRNILAKTFAAQTEKTELVRYFSSDADLIALTELFCAGRQLSLSKKEEKLSNFITSTLLETVTEEKPEVLKTLLRMRQIIHNMSLDSDPASVWQIKLILTFYRNAFTRLSKDCPRKPLVSSYFIEECKFLLEEGIDLLMQKNSIPATFCSSEEGYRRHICPTLCCFAIYHDLPLPHCLPSIVQQGPHFPLSTMHELPSSLTALLRLQQSQT